MKEKKKEREKKKEKRALFLPPRTYGNTYVKHTCCGNLHGKK